MQMKSSFIPARRIMKCSTRILLFSPLSLEKRPSPDRLYCGSGGRCRYTFAAIFNHCCGSDFFRFVFSCSAVRVAI